MDSYTVIADHFLLLDLSQIGGRSLRKRQVFECARCGEKFHNEFTYGQHMDQHDKADNTTCKLCQPHISFPGVSAYWRHLRSIHGITASGRLHPVKPNAKQAGGVSPQGQEEVKMEEDAKEKDKNKVFWEKQIPTADYEENRGEENVAAKRKPGQVAAKRPRSIFRNISQSDAAQNVR